MTHGSRLRSRWALVSGGVVVALVVGAGVVWVRRDDGPPQTQTLGDRVVERRWTLDLPTEEGPDPDAEPDAPPLAIDAGTLYVASRGQLQAIEMASGRRRWEVTFERVVTGLDAGQGVVAVQLEAPFDPDQPDRLRGVLAAFDAGSGERRWGEVSVAEGAAGDPVIAGDLLLVDGGAEGGGEAGGEDSAEDGGGARLQAFDLATGDERWNRPGYSRPCWNGSTLTAHRDADGATARDGLVTVALDDGGPAVDPVETVPGPERVACSADAVVAVGADSASMHDAASLEQTGELGDVRCCWADEILTGATFVADTLDTEADTRDCCPHTLVAHDARTGEELWRHQTPVIGSSPLRYARVGDLVVLANEAGERDEPHERLTRLLDGEGEPLGDIEDGIESPSVLAADPGGDTFAIGDDRELVGFRISPR